MPIEERAGLPEERRIVLVEATLFPGIDYLAAFLRGDCDDVDLDLRPRRRADLNRQRAGG
jgi:hypothetical protein